MSAPKSRAAWHLNEFASMHKPSYDVPGNAGVAGKYVAERIRLNNMGKLRSQLPVGKDTKWYDVPGMIRDVSNEAKFVWKIEGAKTKRTYSKRLGGRVSERPLAKLKSKEELLKRKKEEAPSKIKLRLVA